MRIAIFVISFLLGGACAAVAENKTSDDSAGSVYRRTKESCGGVLGCAESAAVRTVRAAHAFARSHDPRPLDG